MSPRTASRTHNGAGRPERASPHIRLFFNVTTLNALLTPRVPQQNIAQRAARQFLADSILQSLRIYRLGFDC